ncbi:MAG: GNAT family N-acetyltransferase [Bacteroidaceae bacterium]|nr:GNAT family N-acetyltransferase [Bacteroidaceae bacterium]
MKAERYTSAKRLEWDVFVENSINGTFLFKRDFMDYHADRFEDASLMFYNDKRLCAIMPFSVDETTLCSHGGLTYGGLIIDGRTTGEEQLECYNELMRMCKQEGITRVIIKPVPHIYVTQGSEMQAYAMFHHQFQRTACGVSSTVNLRSPLPMQTLRQRGRKKADALGLKIESDTDRMADFHALLSDVLQSRHNVMPVHSLDEMRLLTERFPENIKLYTVINNANQVLAGVWLFITKTTIHAQYIAASDEGTNYGALDLLFSHLIAVSQCDYFDFGISTEHGGEVLNRGLLFQKEGFGGRTTVYETWEKTII